MQILPRYGEINAMYNVKAEELNEIVAQQCSENAK